jgi:hypothetical protein
VCVCIFVVMRYIRIRSNLIFVYFRFRFAFSLPLSSTLLKIGYRYLFLSIIELKMCFFCGPWLDSGLFLAWSYGNGLLLGQEENYFSHPPKHSHTPWRS